MKVQFDTRELTDAEIQLLAEELFKEAYRDSFIKKEDSFEDFIDSQIQFYTEDLLGLHTDQNSVNKIKVIGVELTKDRKKMGIVVVGDKIKLIAGPNIDDGGLRGLECEVLSVSDTNVTVKIPTGHRYQGEHWNLRPNKDTIEIL